MKERELNASFIVKTLKSCNYLSQSTSVVF